MKKFKFCYLVAAMALTGTMAFATSCSNDDDDIKNIPSDFSSALTSMFPGVKNVTWEQEGAYKVADFYYDGFEKDVWFNGKAEWAMTQTEYNQNITALPEPVQAAFASSQYATWWVDEVDGYERPDATFYVIEVEQAGLADQDIYITADGTITQVVPDTGFSVTPTSPIQ